MHIRRSIKSIFILMLFLSTVLCQGQTGLEKAFEEIDRGSTLPEALTTGRSAVFMKVIPQDSVDHPLHWKNLSQLMHKTLAALNIDAVAYYYWQDLNAGIDASNSFLETLREREIDQVLILATNPGTFNLTIVPTDEGPEFLSTEAPTWHTSSNSLEGVLETLAAALRSRGLEVSNFLICDAPEFFEDTRIFKKNRFEAFQPDLKLDKLAVPLFSGDDPENIQNSADLDLSSIMLQYPFSYEMVSYQKGEDLLKNAGFHYVLLSLYAEESTVKALLDYPDPDTSSAKLVYKFYIRHLLSGDIYLGDQWDGHPSWQTALNQHIANLRKSLKVD